MEEVNYKAGDVISTYVYRQDTPTELMGTYEYNKGSLVIGIGSIVVMVGIICYWMGRRKHK